MRVNLQTLATWADTEVVNPGDDIVVTGVSVDTRTLKAGDLFVALVGPNFNGHDFVEDAFEKGAAAALVKDPDSLNGKPGIIAEHTLDIFGQMAHRYRWHEGAVPWVGITGSNGKTTTRTMLKAILGTRGKVAVPQKNYNNLVGVPLTLFSADENDWVGIAEMGTNTYGEISRLTYLVCPTVSIVTCTAEAHLEGLGSHEGVGHEKACIFDRVPGDGVCIYPAQDKCALILSGHIHTNSATFARSGGADMFAEDIESDLDGLRFTVRGVKFELPLIGEHNIENCIAALLAAEHLGVGLEEAAEALKCIEPAPGRMQKIQHKGITIIDDTYNANPSSVMTCVETIVKAKATRKVLIVGSMMELGENSNTIHKNLGKWLSDTKLNVIVAIGRDTIPLAEMAARSSARGIVRHFNTKKSARSSIRTVLQDGDLVAVKGSRGMEMEKVIEAIMGDKK